MGDGVDPPGVSPGLLLVGHDAERLGPPGEAWESDFDVRTADTAEAARKELESAGPGLHGDDDPGVAENRVDCVVSVGDLPDADGVEFLGSLRSTYPALPLVLIAHEHDDVAAAIEAGVTDCVRAEAAADPERLLANRVENAVERYRSTRRVETLEWLHAVQREATSVLTSPAGREEIERSVCDLLTDAEPYAFAVIGEVNHETDAFDPRAWAGDHGGVLDELTNGDSAMAAPGHTAVREAGVAVMEDPDAVATDAGLHAVAAAPVTHRDAEYGVLAVYADRPRTPGDAERELLDRLASDVGHAIHRIDLRERLDAGRRFLEEAQALADVGCWYQHFRTDERYCTGELRRLFDLAPDDDLTVDGVLDHVHAADRERVEAEWMAAKRGDHFDCEFRLVVDGETRWVHGEATVELDADDRPVEAIGVLRDVTERKRRDRERERLAAARQTTSEALWRLYEVGTDPTLTFEEKVERVLDIGTDQLDLSIGYFTRIEDDTQYVRSAVGDHEQLQPGERQALHEAYCRETIEAESPVVIEDAAAEGWAEDPAFERLGLQCYIGAPITVGDEPYGTICFADTTDREFEAGDHVQSLIALIAQWLESALELRDQQTELERAERKWRTLLDGAPDAIFIADAESGRIVETNQAATELLGLEKAAIIGMHQRDLHPAGEEAAYERFFERHQSDAPVSRRTFEDGSPLYVETADGEQVPVEINAREITLGESVYFQGIFRDVSEQLAYERNLSTLNRTTRALLETESVTEVGTVVVEAASDVLDLPRVAFYRFDAEETAFEPVVDADGTDPGDRVATLQPADTAVWDAFTDGELRVVDGSDSRLGAGDERGSTFLVVPVGEHGLLVAGGVQASALRGRVPDLAETLAGTAAAALDRLDRDLDLQARESELAQRNERLVRLNRLNEQLREVSQALVEADSREALERAVCDAMIEIEGIEFGWIGTPDLEGEDLEIRCWAGEDAGYLDSIAVGRSPAARAAVTGEPAFIPAIGDDVHAAEWRQEALAHGYESALSVPLVYEDVVYAVLTLYGSESGTFESFERDVLADFGHAIAMAVNSIERRNALLSDERIELELGLSGPSCAWERLSRQAEAALEFLEVVEQSEGGTRLRIRVIEGSPAAIQSVVADLPSVAAMEVVRDGSEPLVELTLSAPILPTIVADFGVTVREFTADRGSVRATLDVPASVSVRTVVDVLSTQYPDITLRSKTRHEGTVRTEPTAPLTDRLTDRQRESLEVAFESGFFEWPRERTGEEVAEELDVSPSTFHRHIRRAQQETFAALLDPPG